MFVDFEEELKINQNRQKKEGELFGLFWLNSD